MKKVYYKGQPYEFKSLNDTEGNRRFLLMKNNSLVHFVEEKELDRNPVINILRKVYNSSVSLLA